MKITPLDIKKQEFKKTLRGYDAVEVDTFLEMLSEEFESLIREKNEFSDEILKLRTQLRDYQSVETTLKQTLMSAQQNINESRESSERHAKMLVREAEMKAEKILEDAKLKLAEMKNELVIVKAQKDSFARRLRHLLESQLDLIGVLELDDMGFDRGQKRSYPKKTEKKEPTDKLEFEGIEEMMSEKESDANPGSKTFEKAPDLNWKKEQEANQEEEQEDLENLKKNKISDQLII